MNEHEVTGQRSLGKAQSRDTATTLIGIASIAAYVLLSAKLGAGFAIVVGILGACGLTFLAVLRGPVGKAWARKIDGGAGGATAEEIDALYARIEQLEAGQERVAELEERVDFAERLLTRQKDQEQLSPGPQ
ncbi:MAG TPA: hypothetical protein VMJ30_03885 [Gemmatimonadales bacterium]|nr:hypothetical protein [Gemmatimonadales bacterium]